VLAEGIETEEHLRRALAMGAQLGQGWLFGRPSALQDMVPPSSAVPFVACRSDDPSTPFAGLPSSTSPRVATKDLLLPMSHHLEHQALRAPEPPVLLAAFEDVRHFTAGTARRYRHLAEKCSFVGALGAGMSAEPVPGVPGVRGADLALDDILRGEWVVAVVGPHFAGALIARDLLDGGPDRQRRFLFTITYDRSQVIRAANSLLSRIIPRL
jgi:DICT domain-containing protein